MRLAVLAGLMTAAFSSAAIAASVAYVHELQGDAQAVAQGRSRPLQIGSTLEGGERIVTGKGTVTVKFEDGQIVAVGADSIFEITNYDYNKNKVAESNVLLSLLKGGFRYVTGVIGDSRRDSIKFRIGTATAGIRGTDAIFLIGDNGQIIATVQEGAVTFTNQAVTALLNAGQGTVAPPNAPPSNPAPVGTLPQNVVGQAAGLGQRNLPANNPINVTASADLVKAVADAADKANKAAEAAKKAAAANRTQKDIDDANNARAAAEQAARNAATKAAQEAQAAQNARQQALAAGAPNNAGIKPQSTGLGVGLQPQPQAPQPTPGTQFTPGTQPPLGTSPITPQAPLAPLVPLTSPSPTPTTSGGGGGKLNSPN